MKINDFEKNAILTTGRGFKLTANAFVSGSGGLILIIISAKLLATCLSTTIFEEG